MKSLFIAAAVTALLASPLALAQAPGAAADVTQAHVRFNPLSLGNPTSDAALQASLRRAARTVCDDFQWSTLVERARFESCYANALDGARQQLAAARGYASAQGLRPNGG